jgi:hypothetical protein
VSTSTPAQLEHWGKTLAAHSGGSQGRSLSWFLLSLLGVAVVAAAIVGTLGGRADTSAGHGQTFEISKSIPPHEGKAIGSSSNGSTVPECEQYGPANISQQAKASVCLFWYNETTSALTMSSSNCNDGHIQTGSYDGWATTYDALPANSFLTQDYDPNDGQGGNTRVQCTPTWSAGSSAVAGVNFNMDYYDTPTTLGVSVSTSAPGISVHITQGQESNTASIVICDSADPYCSGNFPCPDGNDWMQCEFGNASTNDSPPMAQVAMPGSHDAGTWGLQGSVTSIIDRCGGSVVDVAENVAEDWAQTQDGSAYDQAMAGSRYFDVRGVDEYGYEQHCHSLGAQSWSNIFGLPLGTAAPTSPGLIQFANQQPGEVITIDLTHLYDPASLGTGPYGQVVSDLQTLCNYAIRPSVVANPGTTPINIIRADAETNHTPFLFYMATSDSASGGTDPYAVYSAAVPNCLRSESTSDSGGGINNNSYDTSDGADPMDDYVSPADELDSPGAAFDNFESAQSSLESNEYETSNLSANNTALNVTQYIWNYDPYNFVYLATDNLRSWTQYGLANSYSQNAFPVGPQFVTGLIRAGTAASAYPNVVMHDFIGDGFWGPTDEMIWNSNSALPTPGPVVTVNFQSTAGATGTVHDTALLNCSTVCTQQVPAGDTIYADPGTGTGTFSGSGCATEGTDSCVLPATGVVSVTVTFAPNANTPPAPGSVHLQGENGAIAGHWVGEGTITDFTATAYAAGSTQAAGSCNSPAFNLDYGYCTIDGLMNGTAYTIEITATNNDGTGPPSAPQTVTPSD